MASSRGRITGYPEVILAGQRSFLRRCERYAFGFPRFLLVESPHTWWNVDVSVGPVFAKQSHSGRCWVCNSGPNGCPFSSGRFLRNRAIPASVGFVRVIPDRTATPFLPAGFCETEPYRPVLGLFV